jgi:hypothetical protein
MLSVSPVQAFLARGMRRRQRDTPVPQRQLRRRRHRVRGALWEWWRARCGDRRRAPAWWESSLRRRLDHVQRREQPAGHRGRHPRRPGRSERQGVGIKTNDSAFGAHDELDGARPLVHEQPRLPLELPPQQPCRSRGPPHQGAGGQQQHGRHPRRPLEPRPHPALGDRHGRRLRVGWPGFHGRRRPRRGLRARARDQRWEPGQGRGRGGRARAGGPELHGAWHHQRRAHQDVARFAAQPRVQHHLRGHRHGRRLQPRRHRPAVLPTRPLQLPQAVAGADQRRHVQADHGHVQDQGGGAAVVQLEEAVQ